MCAKNSQEIKTRLYAALHRLALACTQPGALRSGDTPEKSTAPFGRGLGQCRRGHVKQGLQVVSGGLACRRLDLALGLRGRLETRQCGYPVCLAEPHAHQRVLFQPGILHIGFQCSSHETEISDEIWRALYAGTHKKRRYLIQTLGGGHVDVGSGMPATRWSDLQAQGPR